jgi:hypothetical protein
VATFIGTAWLSLAPSSEEESSVRALAFPERFDRITSADLHHVLLVLSFQLASHDHTGLFRQSLSFRFLPVYKQLMSFFSSPSRNASTLWPTFHGSICSDRSSTSHVPAVPSSSSRTRNSYTGSCWTGSTDRLGGCGPLASLVCVILFTR